MGKQTFALLGVEAEASNRLFTTGLTKSELDSVVALLDRMFANRTLGG